MSNDNIPESENFSQIFKYPERCSSQHILKRFSAIQGLER